MIPTATLAEWEQDSERVGVVGPLLRTRELFREIRRLKEEISHLASREETQAFQEQYDLALAPFLAVARAAQKLPLAWWSEPAFRRLKKALAHPVVQARLKEAPGA